MAAKVRLGDVVRDEVTGFSGLVTAICRYRYSSTQVEVSPMAINGKGERVKESWIPLKRLEVIRERETLFQHDPLQTIADFEEKKPENEEAGR